MATTKRSKTGGGKSTASRSRAATGSAKKTPGRASGATRSPIGKKAQSANAQRSASKNGAKAAPRSRASSGGKTSSRNGASRTRASARNRAVQPQNGMVGTLKKKGTAVLQAADKAGGPALTVAAAAAGIAGGLALRQRPRIAHESVAARSRTLLRDVDPSAVLEGIGKAAVELSHRSKTIARNLDHVADRAERIGKTLS
jgi:hypothetical protein